jgi:UDP-glucose:(heptosyl)LPS alpha-1,3-glucosyltransferase
MLAGNAAARQAARAIAEPLSLSAMAERLLELYRGLGGASSRKV